MSRRGEPSREELRAAVESAIARLFENDAHLLTSGVNERSITHRLAMYLQDEFPDWHVDAEYNRDSSDPKRLGLTPEATESDDLRAVTVYPDIAIHRRGTDQNLLVIEAKKDGASGAEFDHQKLKAFTRPRANAGLGYCWGVHLVVPTTSREQPTVVWFAEGQRLDAER